MRTLQQLEPSLPTLAAPPPLDNEVAAPCTRPLLGRVSLTLVHAYMSTASSASGKQTAVTCNPKARTCARAWTSSDALLRRLQVAWCLCSISALACLNELHAPGCAPRKYHTCQHALISSTAWFNWLASKVARVRWLSVARKRLSNRPWCRALSNLHEHTRSRARVQKATCGHHFSRAHLCMATKGLQDNSQSSQGRSQSTSVHFDIARCESNLVILIELLLHIWPETVTFGLQRADEAALSS